MNYLLDTCVISELIRSRPSGTVTAWMQSIDEPALYLSVLTLGELHKGIAKLSATSSRRRILEEWVDRDLVIRFANRMLPVSADVAERWGRLVGEAERRGQRLPVIDALIGATAIESNLTVVTRNVDHFERAGVPVFNPWLVPHKARE